MEKAYTFKVSGRVQGVGFRYFTQIQANNIGIYGTVKNDFDGSVSGFAQGSEENLNLFFNILKKGPILAKVNDLKINEAPTNSSTTFTISF